ncbi:hypothetical protein [Leucobacter aridicollis]|uniref:Uncharacterized protein n=1 Tax=Leucobacter aridicollis TaxID=283878 RepID=A0A852QUT4_9MICO|nr:hypothetical protein [Leucobacter aridicollis]MBL3682614.1 hypothetical protein [Leucobacter aridicollis]NYD26033.1 hypothetical protein [Leucobacter aridicollis]
MHYYALVEVPEGDEPFEKRLAAVLAPHKEGVEGGSELWDWWILGGRWSGRLSGYDPYTDPVNQKRCWLCQGTKFRNDELGKRERALNPEYTCNGCGGTGLMTVHESEFVPHAGNVAKFGALSKEMQPHVLIANGQVVQMEAWTGSEWEDTSAALTELWGEIDPDATVAVVDLHR